MDGSFGAEDFAPKSALVVPGDEKAVVAGMVDFPFILGSSSGSTISDGRMTSEEDRSVASTLMIPTVDAKDFGGNILPALRFFDGLSSSMFIVSSTSVLVMVELEKQPEHILTTGTCCSISSVRCSFSSSGGGLERLLPFGTVASMISRAVSSGSFALG